MSKTNHLLALTVVVAIALMLATTAGAQQLKFQSAPPESCCVYSYWNAASKNDPNSKNEAERLLAEPEVQRFIDNTIQRIGKIAPALMLDQPEAKQTLMRSIAPELTSKLFKNRGSFFIEEIKFGEKQQLENFKALLMVDAGADARTLAAELAQMFASDELVPMNATIPGHEFVKFSIYDDPKVELVLGAADEMLMIGFGEKTVADALQRISASKPPAWLTDFQSNKNATRVINFSYFNVAKIKRSVKASMDEELKRRFSVVETAGFGNVESIETCVGFSEQQAFSRMFVRTDGEPEGILAADSKDGLLLDDVRHFPKDSLLAAGISKQIFGWFQLFQWVSTGRTISRWQYEFSKVTGINFPELLNKMSDKWTIYNGVGDGLFSGMVVTGSVASGKELTSASIDEQIKKRLIWDAKNNDRVSDLAKLSKRNVGTDEIYTVRPQEIGWALQPSFSISGERVLFGLYPQAVESALKQIHKDDHEPLVDQAMLDKMSKSFAGAADTKLLGFAYVDAANQFSTAYPYVQLAIGSAGSIVDQMSVPAESRSALKQLASGIYLPPARSIHQHLSPSYSMARTTEAGVEFETWQSIPAIDPGFAGPAAFGMLLPAVQQVRQNARKTVSMNNMRQMALACLNYESARRTFPAGYSTNEEGKKLLSWRVAILPYIEQGDFFNKFKLDEPWDSPNNKALLAEMPDVFRSPVSKAKKGLTVYRGVGGNEKGSGGVLRAPWQPGSSEGIRISSVTDGTSNTILLFETSDTLAQEWTKPDEGLDCVNVDKEGIFGAYSGGTIVALADGSTRFLVDSVSQRR